MSAATASTGHAERMRTVDVRAELRVLQVLVRLMATRLAPAAMLMLPLLGVQWIGPSISAVMLAQIGVFAAIFVAFDDMKGFETLPMSGRTLASARVLARICVAGIPTLALLVALSWRTTRPVPPGFATIVLALALLTALAPTVATAVLDRRARWAQSVAAIGVGPGAFLVVIANTSPQTAGAIGTAMVLAFGAAVIYLLRSMSDVMLLAPMALTDASAQSSDVDRSSRLQTQVTDSQLHWRDKLRLAWRSIDGPMIGAEVLPMFLAATAGLGGTIGVSMILLGSSGTFVMQQRLAWLRMLPVRTRTRALLLAAAPTIGVVLLVVAPQLPLPLTHYSHAPEFNAPSAEDAQGTDWTNRTRLPFALWRRARHDGAVMTIVAPWGERVELFTVRALGTTWYNPYSTRRESSERMVDMQWRLSTELYGTVIPRRTSDDERWPPRVLDRWPVLLVYGAIVLSLLLVMRTLSLHQTSVRRRDRVIGWTGQAVVFAMVMWDVTSLKLGSMIVSTIQRCAFAITESVPLVTVPLIALTPVVVALLLLTRTLGRLEHAPVPLPVTSGRG